MAQSLSLSEFFEDGKYPKLVLAVGAILLLLLQLGIFVAVYNQSGLKSRVCIVDSSGRKIYESPGAALSSYEKMVFENNFGPLRDYTTQIESEMVPFNFRAWILLAVGMPLGLILMLFFMAQVWLILLNGSPKEGPPEETELSKTRFSFVPERLEELLGSGCRVHDRYVHAYFMVDTVNPGRYGEILL